MGTLTRAARRQSYLPQASRPVQRRALINIIKINKCTTRISMNNNSSSSGKRNKWPACANAIVATTTLPVTPPRQKWQQQQQPTSTSRMELLKRPADLQTKWTFTTTKINNKRNMSNKLDYSQRNNNTNNNDRDHQSAASACEWTKCSSVSPYFG